MVHHKETSRIAVFKIGIFLFQLFKQVIHSIFIYKMTARIVLIALLSHI